MKIWLLLEEPEGMHQRMHGVSPHLLHTHTHRYTHLKTASNVQYILTNLPSLLHSNLFRNTFHTASFNTFPWNLMNWISTYEWAWMQKHPWGVAAPPNRSDCCPHTVLIADISSLTIRKVCARLPESFRKFSPAWLYACPMIHGCSEMMCATGTPCLETVPLSTSTLSDHPSEVFPWVLLMVWLIQMLYLHLTSWSFILCKWNSLRSLH